MSAARHRVGGPERLRVVVTVEVDALLALRACQQFGVSPQDTNAIEIVIGARSVGYIDGRRLPDFVDRIGLATRPDGWRYELGSSDDPKPRRERETLPPLPGYGAPISPRECTRRSGARPIEAAVVQRVMVVEDEPQMRARLLRRFTEAGVTCAVFATAVRAASFAKAQPAGVELALVTKHELRRIPGAALARCVRRIRTNAVPTIVFSSAYAASTIPVTESDGAYAVLGAPLDVDGLVATTLEMLAFCARPET